MYMGRACVLEVMGTQSTQGRRVQSSVPDTEPLKILEIKTGTASIISISATLCDRYGVDGRSNERSPAKL